MTKRHKDKKVHKITRSISKVSVDSDGLEGTSQKSSKSSKSGRKSVKKNLSKKREKLMRIQQHNDRKNAGDGVNGGGAMEVDGFQRDMDNLRQRKTGPKKKKQEAKPISFSQPTFVHMTENEKKSAEQAASLARRYEEDHSVGDLFSDVVQITSKNGSDLNTSAPLSSTFFDGKDFEKKVEHNSFALLDEDRNKIVLKPSAIQSLGGGFQPLP